MKLKKDLINFVDTYFKYTAGILRRRARLTDAP